MEYVLWTLVGILLGVICRKMVLWMRVRRYNRRQFSIYLRTLGLVREQALASSLTRDDTVHLLNAVVDAYNEGLQGTTRQLQAWRQPHFPAVHTRDETIGLETRRSARPAREEPKGKEPGRTAR